MDRLSLTTLLVKGFVMNALLVFGGYVFLIWLIGSILSFVVYSICFVLTLQRIYWRLYTGLRAGKVCASVGKSMPYPFDDFCIDVQVYEEKGVRIWKCNEMSWYQGVSRSLLLGALISSMWIVLVPLTTLFYWQDR